MKIKLGDKVRDIVSGLEGVAIARHTYLQGCDRISIQPRADVKAGTVPKSHSFDEPELEVIKPEKVKKKKGTAKGGPAKFEDRGKVDPVQRR